MAVAAFQSATQYRGIQNPPVEVPHLISRAEFLDSLKYFYAAVDPKGRGYFTAEDIASIGYHMADPPVIYPRAAAEAPFHCVDANGDGRVTHEEYVGYAARAFDAAAVNGHVEPYGRTMNALTRAISSHDGCK
jgi:hypothetical protein